MAHKTLSLRIVLLQIVAGLIYFQLEFSPSLFNCSKFNRFSFALNRNLAIVSYLPLVTYNSRFYVILDIPRLTSVKLVSHG